MTDLSKIVKPLDLSNLLKYAYLSGFVAAKDLPGHEPYDGRKSWLDFDPTPCPAYARILAAIDIDALIRRAIEEGLRMARGDDLCVTCGAPRNHHPYRHPFVSRDGVNKTATQALIEQHQLDKAITAAVERVKGGAV